MITAVSLVLLVLLSSLIEAGSIAELSVSEGAMEVKIRCNDWATDIYIDGRQVGSTGSWGEVWTRDIGAKSRLIAVNCYSYMYRHGGGLIASFANGLVSDETWKCRHYTDDDTWYRLDTDDTISPWNSAYVIPASLAPSIWNTSGTFPDKAKWIWKDSWFNRVITSSLCRAELGISMYIKLSHHGRVYADGVAMSSVGQIRNTKTKILIPRTTHLVAIEGYNWGNNAYIQAILPNGYRTDTSWRCTDVYDRGWHSTDYDDSHWDHATDYGPGDIGAGDDVRKIWTADITNDSYIHCRGHFECGCEYICEEHENEYDFGCLCPEGFTLAKDGLSCDEDVCGLQNPGCEDVCVNTGQSYKCECSMPGYEVDVDMHSCININECERDMHNCSQTCVDTEGAFRCECFEGFTLQQDQVSCNDINECDENNGNCDHLCVNKHGNYVCDCTSGYELTSDGHTCSDFNECDMGTHNCSNTMVCENTASSFTCVCPTGYKLGRDMVTCQDIDECEVQNRLCDQTCLNTVGSYMCDCSDGYSLADDGHACSLDSAADKTRGSNSGLFAGIVTTLLVIVVVALLIGGFVWLRRRHRRRHAREENNPDKAASSVSNSRTLDRVYYNVERADQRGEPSYENVRQVGTEAKREQANSSSSHLQQSVSGDEVEASAERANDLPHVYYNVGRVDTGDETPYEDVSGLHNGALRSPEPDKAPTSTYASLNRQLEENDERSPYTELA